MSKHTFLFFFSTNSVDFAAEITERQKPPTIIAHTLLSLHIFWLYWTHILLDHTWRASNAFDEEDQTHLMNSIKRVWVPPNSLKAKTYFICEKLLYAPQILQFFFFILLLSSGYLPSFPDFLFDFPANIPPPWFLPFSLCMWTWRKLVREWQTKKFILW